MNCIASCKFLRMAPLMFTFALAQSAYAAEDAWTGQSIDEFETGSRFGPSCRLQIAAKGIASGPTAAQNGGLLAIAYWQAEVAKEMGPEFANFKLAKDGRVRCRREGNSEELHCIALGYPCSQ